MTNTPATKPASSSKFLLPILLVIIVVTVVGYLAATRSGIDKKAVEQAITQWGNQLTLYGKSQNQDITFAYESVDMKGEAAGRHAVVNKPSITIKTTAEDTGAVEVTRISTTDVALYLDSVALDKVKLEAEKPLEVFVNDELAGVILSSEPLVLKFARLEESDTNWISTSLALPEKLTLQSINESDTMIFNMDKGANLAGIFNEQLHSFKKADVAIDKLRIEGAQGEQYLSADTIRLNSVSNKGIEDNYRTTLAAEISNLMTTPEEMPYGAISASADMVYDGPLPSEGETLDWASTPSTLELRTLRIAAKDASAELSGQFSTGGGELLPVGKAMLKVVNFGFIRDELLKHGALDKETQKVVDILVSKMAAKPMAGITDLDLPISREKGKSLQIGQMTFEEAITVVLTGGKLAPAAPATPVEIAPKTTTE